MSTAEIEFRGGSGKNEEICRQKQKGMGIPGWCLGLAKITLQAAVFS